MTLNQKKKEKEKKSLICEAYVTSNLYYTYVKLEAFFLCFCIFCLNFLKVLFLKDIKSY